MVSKSLLLTTNNKLMMIMVEQIKGRCSFVILKTHRYVIKQIVPKLTPSKTELIRSLEFLLMGSLTVFLSCSSSHLTNYLLL